MLYCDNESYNTYTYIIPNKKKYKKKNIRKERNHKKKVKAQKGIVIADLRDNQNNLISIWIVCGIHDFFFLCVYYDTDRFDKKSYYFTSKTTKKKVIIRYCLGNTLEMLTRLGKYSI